MQSGNAPIAHIAFVGAVIEWRGPAPFFFVAVPDDRVGEMRYAARIASYGWGVVPVRAVVNGSAFTTSLFPRNDGYLLPLKAAVRKAGAIGLGDRVTVEIQVIAKAGFEG